MFAALWLSLLSECLAGSVDPDASHFLQVTSSSAGAQARYIFAFAIHTQVVRTATVQVHFPAEFSDAVAAGTPQCFAGDAGTVETVPCSIASKSVWFTVPHLYLGTQELGLWDVVNPLAPGVTAPFQVSTYLDNLLLDSNSNCPPLLVTPAAHSISAFVSVIGSTVASESADYRLKIEPLVAASGFFVRVVWPMEYQARTAFQSCVWEDTPAPVLCAYPEPWSRLFEIRPASLQASMTFTIKAVPNPRWATTTGFFSIEVVRDSDMHCEYAASVPGVVIGPGAITLVALTYGTAYNDGVNWYTLKFDTNSAVPEGGRIVVTLPAAFQGCTDCAVVSGLTPRPGLLICETHGNAAAFQHFDQTGTVVLRVQARAPQTGATATGILVQTDCGEGGKVVDTLTLSQVIAFTSSDSAKRVEIDMFRRKTEVAIGEYGPLELYLQSFRPLPASLAGTENRIEIECPASVETFENSAQLTCLFGAKRLRAQVCQWNAGTIVVTTPQGEALDCCPLSLVISTVSTKSTAGLRVSPLFPGRQRFVIRVFHSNVLEEEAEYYYTPAAKDLNSPNGVAKAGTVAVDFMHLSAGKSNVVTVVASLSVALPAQATIEFELDASAIDTSLIGTTPSAFPCVYRLSAAGAFETCRVWRDGNVFVSFDSCSQAISTDPQTFILPEVVNSSSAGVFPTLTVRSVAPDGAVTEYGRYKSPAPLTANPTLVLTPPNSFATLPVNTLAAVNVDFSLSLSLPSPLSAGDVVTFVFPKSFQWVDAPSQTATTPCGSGSTLGTISDYQTLSSLDVNKIVFTAKSPVPSGKVTVCVQIPSNSSSLSPSVVEVAVVQGQAVTSAGQLPLSAPTVFPPPPAAVLAVSERLKDTSKHLQRTRTLYELSYKVGLSISPADGVAILLDNARFSSADAGCYSAAIGTQDLQCNIALGVTFKGVLCTAIVVSGFVKTAISAEVLTVAAWTKPLSPGSADIWAAAFHGPFSDELYTDSASTSISIDSLPVPQSLSPDLLQTPLIEARVGEFGPLSIKFTPQVDLPSTTASAQYSVRVVFPQSAAFSQAAGSALDCSFDSVVASHCELDLSVPRSVRAYTPTSGTLLHTVDHSLVLSTKGATNPVEIGFQAPSVPGDYEFLVELYSGATLLGRSESWVAVLPPRLLKASVASMSKGADHWNVLVFDFTSPVAMSSALSGGAVFMRFPAAMWRSDFGAGYSADIDCVDAGSTVALTAFSCTLINRDPDSVTVKLSGFDAVAAHSRFRYFFGPAKNPVAVLTDFSISVALQVEDISVPSDPRWVAVAVSTFSYIDTTMAVAQSVLTDTFPSSNKFLGVAVVYGVGATLQVNVVNNLPMNAGDRILLKLESGFAVSGATCALTPAGGSAVAVLECIAFERAGWVLATLPVALSTVLPHSLSVTGLRLPQYSSSVTFTSYYFRDRKNFAVVSHPDLTAQGNGVSQGKCTVATSVLQTALQGYAETYSILLTCEHPVPRTGSIVLTFPPAFAGLISDHSCAIGPKSAILLSSLTCSLRSPMDIEVSGLEVPANTAVELQVTATNPAAGSHSPFAVQTYYSPGKPTDCSSDLKGVTITWPVALSPLPLFSLGEEPAVHSFHDYVTTTANVGPLVLTMKSPTAVLKSAGVVTITAKKSIDVAGELLCIWTQSDSDYVAQQCSLAADTLSISAPKDFDIIAGVLFTITVTSRNAPQAQGLLWTGGEGQYALDVTIDGSGAVSHYRTYAEVRPAFIPEMTVKYDHVTSGFPNRFRVSFRHDAAIPDSASHGRLVLEFPSSVFATDLGPDHSPVSCRAVQGLGSASCYLQRGDSAASEPARIVVTGFAAVPAGTLVEVHFDQVRNPSAHGDDVIASVTLVIANVAGGWPGQRTAVRSAEFLYSAQSTPPTQAISSAAAVTLVANGNVADSSGEYSLPVTAPTGGFLPDDLVVLYIDSRVGIASGSAICTHPLVGSCEYYPLSNSLFISVTGATSDFAVSVSPFRNSDSTLPVGLSLKSHVIRNSKLIATATHPPSAVPFFSPLPLASLSVSRADTGPTHYRGDVTDLLVTFQTSLPLPPTSTIQVTLPAGFSAASGNCYNYHESISQLRGVINCVYASGAFLATQFQALAAASTVSLLLSVRNTGVPGTYALVVTTCRSSLQEVIQSGTAPLTISSAEAPTYHELPLQFHIYTEARSGSAAPFQVLLSLDSPLTSTGSIAISFQEFSSVALAPGGELICFIGDTLASTCELIGKSVRIGSTETVAAGTYQLSVTTKNADDYESNGLMYPSPGRYALTLIVTPDNTGLNSIYASDYLEVLPALEFASLTVQAAQQSVNSYNSFSIRLQTSAAVDRLAVLFPTADRRGSLFEDDLGLGLPHTASYRCDLLGLSGKCALAHGGHSVARPATIEVSSFGVLPSGGAAQLVFDGIRNPPIAVSDSAHIHISVYGYLGSSLVVAQTFYDVMTMSWTAPVALSAASASSLCAYSPSLVLALPSTCRAADTCVVQLPPEVSLAGADCGVECSVRSAWVALQPSADRVSLTITFAANAIPYVSPVLTAKYLIWRVNSYGVPVSISETAISIPPAFDRKNALKTGPLYSVSGTNIPQSSAVWFAVSYQVTDFIPSSGCIKVAFPATLTLTGTFCYANGDSTSDFYSIVNSLNSQCTVAGSSLTVKGFSALGNSSVVSLRALVSTASATSAITGVTFRSYYDPLCTLMIESDDGTNSSGGYTVNPSIKMVKNFAMERVLTPMATRPQGGDAVVKFTITPSTLLAADPNTSIELQFPSPPTVPPGTSQLCDISNAANRVRTVLDCSLSAATLWVRPRSDLLPASSYTVTAYSQGVDGRSGLTLPSSYTSVLTFRLYNKDPLSYYAFGDFPIAIPDYVLADLQITPMHTTAGELNVFSVTFTTPAVGKQTYSVVTEFPCESEASLPLFDDCLGSGLTQGADFPCMQWTPRQTTTNAYVTCSLSCGRCPFATPRVKAVMALVPGAVVNYSVVKVANPSVAASDWDRAIVHIRVYIEEPATGKVVAEGTVWNLFSVDKTPPASPTSFSVSLSQSYVTKATLSTITLGMTPYSSSLTAFLFTSRDVNFAASCAPTQCTFPSGDVCWGAISASSGNPAGSVAPWLSLSQGTVDYFVGVGRKNGHTFQQYALYKALGKPVTSLNVRSLSLSQYLSLKRTTTWQFVRLFFSYPSGDVPDTSARVCLVGGSGTYSDNDEESLELTEGWPSNTKWRYDYSGRCFFFFGYSTISPSTRLGLRVLARTGTSTCYFSASVMTAAGVQFASDSTSVSLTEDPIGGFKTAPTVVFTGGTLQVSFALNWKFDNLQCVSGITRVNLVDRPFGISPFTSQSVSTCNYNGYTCESCSLKYKIFSAGEAVLMMGSGSINAGTAITLTLKTVQAPTPGWNSIGIVVEHDKWTFYNYADPLIADYCYLTTAYLGKSCRDLTGYVNCSPTACATSAYWAPEPTDAVALLFTKTPVLTISPFSTSLYANALASPFGVTLQGSVPSPLGPSDYLRFGFEGTKFPASLGLSPGDTVPFVDPTGMFAECWVEGSCSGTVTGGYYPSGGSITCGYAAVWCRVKDSLSLPSSTFQVQLLYLVSPSTTGTSTANLKMYSFSGGGFAIEAESSSQSFPSFSGAPAATNSVTLALSNPTISSTNTLNLLFSGPFNAGDVVLISLGYLYTYVSGSLPTPPADVTYSLLQVGVMCPCLLATPTASLKTVTVSVPGVANSLYSTAQPSLSATTYLKSAVTPANYVFTVAATTPGSLQDLGYAIAAPPMYPNQGAYFSLSFRVVEPLPANSVIEVTVPGSVFQAASGFAATSNQAGYTHIFATAAVGPDWVISVSGNTSVVAAGTLIAFSNLWGQVALSPTTGSISVLTYTVVSAVKKPVHTSVLVSISVTETLYYLSPYNIALPPSFRGGAVTPNGSSESGVLRLFFQVQTALVASASTTTTGYVLLTFPAGAIAIGSTPLYGLFTDSSFKTYYSYGVAATATSIKVSLPAYTSLLANTVVSLEVGLFNGGVGLAVAPNTLINVEIRDAPSGFPVLYYQPQVVFPLGSRFSEITVKPSALNSGLENYLTVTFRPSASIAEAEIAVEFPLVDYWSSVDLFAPSLGTSVSERGLLPCALTQGTAPVTTVFCRFAPGDGTTNLDKVRKPARIVLYGAQLLSGSQYTFVVGGFANPALSSLRIDLAVFLRYRWPASHFSQGDGVYQYGDYAFVRPILTTVSEATSSGTEQYQSAQSSTYVTDSSVSWTLQNAQGVASFDLVVFKLPSILTLSASSTVTLSSSTSRTYIIPSARCVVLAPDGPTSLSSTFVFKGVGNPPYIVSSWTIADVAVSAVFYSAQRHVRNLLYSDNAPSAYYSVLNPTLPTLLPEDNALSTNYQTLHTFTVTAPVAIPGSGMISITLPAALKSLGGCQAKINNFGISAACVSAAGQWTIKNFGADLPLGTPLSVFGLCMNPATPGSQSGSLVITADTSGSLVMLSGSFTTPIFVSDGRVQDPVKMTLIPQVLSPRLVRTGDFGPLSLIFQPQVTLAHADASVKIAPSSDFTYSPGSYYLVCKFLNVKTGEDYRAGRCTYSSGAYEALLPPNTDLLATERYQLRVHTAGRDPALSRNGLQYPSLKSIIITTQLLQGGTPVAEFADLLQVVPLYSSFSALTAKPVSLHASDAATLMVDINFSVGTGEEPAVVFPASLFAADLGSGLPFHGSAGCDYSPTVLSGAGRCDCRLVPALYANMSSRNSKLQLRQPSPYSGLVRYFLPRVKNPASGSDVWIAAAVYRYSAAGEDLVHFGVIFNAFRTVPAVVRTDVSEQSLTANLASTEVSVVTSSSLSTSVSVPANSYVLFTFPVGLELTTSISHQLASHSPYQLLSFTASALAPGTVWLVGGIKNPPHPGLYGDVLASIYNSGKYVSSAVFALGARPYVKSVGVVSATLSTYDGGQLVAGMPIWVALTLTSSVNAGGGLIITFTGASQSTFCQASDAALGDFMSCEKSSNAYILATTQTAATGATIRFLLTGAPATSINVKTYSDAGAWTDLIAEGTVAASFQAYQLISAVSIVSPVQAYKVVRKGDCAPLTLSFRFGIPITSGFVQIKLPPSSYSIDFKSASLRCVWLSSTSQYLGRSCSLTVLSELTISAPEVTALAAAQDWQVIVTTVNQKGGEGMTVDSSYRCGDYWITAATLPSGVASEFGAAKLSILPTDLTSAQVHSYSRTTARLSALEINFTPSVAVSSGIEAGGFTEILLQFGKNSYVVSDSLGVNTNHGTTNYGDTDCYTAGSLLNARCSVKKGQAGSPPQVWVRRFPSIPQGTSAQLTIVPFSNPTTNGQNLHVRMWVQEFASAQWTFTQFREFDYVSMTESYNVAGLSGVGMSYSNPLPQASSSLVWSVVSSAPTHSLLLFRQSPHGGSLLGSTDCHVLAINDMLAINPVLPSLVSVSVPAIPCGSGWSAEVISAGVTTDALVYTTVNCNHYDISATARAVRLADINVPKHVEGRMESYRVYFKPTVTIPVGGRVEITAPSAYSAVGNACKVLHGLSGSFSCAHAAGTNTYVITGFNSYSFASTHMYIALEMQLTAGAPAIAAPFIITVYDLTSVTETATFASFEIVPALPVLSAAVQPLFWARKCAPLADFAEILVKVTPSVAYPYGTSITLNLPVGASSPAGAVFECAFLINTNSIPNNGPCLVDSAVHLSVPEQLTVAAGTSFSILLRARDSGSLFTNGIQLPGAADLTVASGNPQAVFWYFYSDVLGTVLEASKFGCNVCGKSYLSLSLTPGHSLAGAWNFLDFSFQTDSPAPVTVLAFETHTGACPLFDTALGHDSGASIDCAALTGFTAVTCSMQTASVQSPTTPVLLYVSGLPALGTNSLRIAKIKNPASSVDPLFNLPVTATINVYSLSGQLTVNQGAVYRVFDNPPLYSTPLPTELPATVAIAGALPLPLAPNSFIDSPNFIEFKFGGNSATALSAGSGFIVLQLSSDFRLSGGVVCQGFASCQLSTHELANWLVLAVTSGSATPSIGSSVKLSKLTTPKTNNASGYSVTACVISSSRQWTDTYSALMANLQTLVAPAPKVTTTVANRNTYGLFTIEVDMKGVQTDVKRVDFVFPAEFQWVDAQCRSYSGMVGGCSSDCGAETCSKRVSLSSFQLAPGKTALTFSIGAMSPSVSGPTSQCQLFYFASSTDTSLVVQQTLAAGDFLINPPTYPFNVWLEWPSVDLYSRAVTVGSVGDVIVRVQNSEVLPAGSGVLRVSFADKYSLEPQGTPLCYLAYGDFPLDNLSTDTKGIVESPHCEWDGDTVSIDLPGVQLRNWYGIGAKCAWAVLTTTGSLKTDGYLLKGVSIPPDPVDKNFTVSEVPPPSNPSATSAIDGVEVIGLVSDAGVYSHFAVAFTVKSLLARSYDYVHAGQWGDTSAIEVRFGTIDSFETDLSGAGACYVEKGLSPHGERLNCTVGRDPGEQYTVATVTGYEEVEPGTRVTMCFPRLRNPTVAGSTAKVTVGVYTKTHAGEVHWLYRPALLPPYNATVRVASAAKLTHGFLNWREKAVRLPLEIQYDLGAGDSIVIDFSPQFQIDSLVVTLSDSSTGADIYPYLYYRVYALVLRVIIALPGRLPAATHYSLSLENLSTPQCLVSWVTYFTVSRQVLVEEFSARELLDQYCAPFIALAFGPFGQQYNITFSRKVTRAFVAREFALATDPESDIGWSVVGDSPLVIEVTGGPWKDIKSIRITFLTEVRDDEYSGLLSTAYLDVPPPADVETTFPMDQSVADSTGNAVLGVGGSLVAVGAASGGGSLAMSLLSQMQYFSYISTANYTMTGSMGSFYASLNQKSMLPNVFGASKGVKAHRLLLEGGMEIINPEDFLDNAGQFLTIFTGIVVIHSILWILKRVSKSRFLGTLCSKFQWNVYLCFWYFAYLDFQVAALLQLCDYGFDISTGRLFLCTFFALLTLLSAVPTPFVLYWFISRHSTELFSESELRQRFSVLSSSLRSDHLRAKYLYPVYYFQRLLYSFLIVFMRGMEIYQAVALLVPSFLMLAFVLAARPMRTRAMRALHFLAELDALLVFVLLCFLTLRYNTPQIDICYVIVGFTLKSVTCTALVALVSLISRLNEKCRSRRKMREVHPSVNVTWSGDLKPELQIKSKRPLEDFRKVHPNFKVGDKLAVETLESEMESPTLPHSVHSDGKP